MSLLLSALIETGASGGVGGDDDREFKRWQDWYGQSYGDSAPYECEITQSTRSINGVSKERRAQTSSFTVPSGVTKVRITCIGAGGGGGRRNTHYHAGAGGGGGVFSSGEFNVTAGQVLDVTIGKSGRGRDRDNNEGGTGYSGDPSHVQMSSPDGGQSALYVYAAGGSGGPEHSTGGARGTTKEVSGSSLVSGSDIKYNGGNGGNGSSNSAGWGPEGYSAGGGGSAGSWKGDGFRGGNADNKMGYSWAAASGGGIGGRGAEGRGSDTTSDQYTWSGGGGGSNGAGFEGDNNDNNAYSDTSKVRGGDGTSEKASVSSYTYTNVSNQNVSYGKNDGEMHTTLTTTSWKMMHGARYGDGEESSDAGEAGGGSADGNSQVTYNAYESQLGKGGSGGGGGGAGFTDGGTTSVTGAASLPAKMFNGILGRCQGGGGAGAGSKSSNGTAEAYSAGQGGAGAGGAGSACCTSNGNANAMNKRDTFVWSAGDMAWRWTDNMNSDTNSMAKNGGCGGAGGALGGGGGSTNYGCGGGGGIGGGGGGCGGHYNGSSYNGCAGDGGPGYVLIEW
tara:strand:+ start:2678 stop:4360 length:1683 start_codon:yes stop_codon:yes gene_type:complete